MSRRSIPRLAAALLLAVGVAGCGGGGGPDAPIALTASPLPARTEDGATPAPAASPSPHATPSPSRSPTPSPRATASGPTDTDRARFVARYRPEGATDLDSVAADVDGDGTKELVFVFVDTAEDEARVQVAWWDPDEGYAIGFTGSGGPAERIQELIVRDVNADGRVELVTFQEGGSRGSLALWQVTAPGRVVPLIARGGCHAGSHVYGAIGAELVQADADPAAEISATCNDAPLPVSEWSRDVYDWRDGAYRVRPTDAADDDPGSPSGSEPDGED